MRGSDDAAISQANENAAGGDINDRRPEDQSEK